MNSSEKMLDALKSRLPEHWQAVLDELAVGTLQTVTPLRLTLVGGFSVGKSSLLNTLLGESLLFTAKEEATALPTFLEYGESPGMTLIGSDGSALPLERADFQRVTTCAPEGAACAVVALPLDWLKGVVVIDLPGLGSVSAAHQEYTLAQIQQTDAVLYLIEPRGPTQSDLSTLALIRQYGKRVKIAVARWDEVEAAVVRGEKAPSLEQWAAQIEEKTGLKVRLATVSHHGHGREDVLEFVARAKEDVSQIRLNRFKAELLPALQNALGSNVAEQQACETLSEESGRQRHADLLLRKQQLIDFKSGLYEQQHKDKQTAEQLASTATESVRKPLRLSLQALADGVGGEADWDRFGTAGADRLREALTTLADTLSGQSAGYGELNLPPVAIEQFNLRLPAPETVEAGDFLEMAKLTQLQSELNAKQVEFAAKQEHLNNTPDIDLDADEQALQALMMQGRQIAAEPLPRIVQRMEGNGAAAIGRMVGEMADIALIFVNPATVGAKAASLVGKGAKAVNVAVKTKQVAKTVSSGVKLAQAMQTGKPHKDVPAPVMEKLGMLEFLSLGYWGEKIGTMLGGAPTEYEVIDPEARAAQEQALAEVNGHILQLRRELARKEDMANERQLSGWALEQSRQEQARLQADIQRLVQQAGQRQQEAQQAIREAHQQTVRRHAERAVAQWLRSFDQQGVGMATLLLARVKQYWEGQVDALLAERVAEVDALVKQMQAAPQEKAVRLAALRVEAETLRAVVGELT